MVRSFDARLARRRRVLGGSTSNGPLVQPRPDFTGRREKNVAEDLARRMRCRLVPHLSCLAAQSVRPITQVSYLRCLALLLGYLGRLCLPSWSATVWDEVLEKYLEHLFEENLCYETGSRVLAGLRWADPALPGPQKVAFPRATRILAGWRRIEPGMSRPPIPFEVAALIAKHLIAAGRPELALLTMVCFEGYLRPSEGLALAWWQIIPPRVSQGRLPAECLTLLVHAEENQVPTKTNEYDVSVAFDLDRHQAIIPALLALREQGRLNPSRSLWRCSYEDYLAAFKKAAVTAKVNVLAPTPYGLRHGGASHDRGFRCRDLASVQQRGNWRSFASVRRYEKHGRFHAQLLKLPVCIQLEASQAVSFLSKFWQSSFAQRINAVGGASLPSSSSQGRGRSATN